MDIVIPMTLRIFKKDSSKISLVTVNDYPIIDEYLHNLGNDEKVIIGKIIKAYGEAMVKCGTSMQK
jgi:hypothetical protein